VRYEQECRLRIITFLCLANHIGEKRQKGVAAICIEGGCRFVCDHECWRANNGASDGDPLLLSGGEMSDGRVEVCMDIEAMGKTVHLFGDTGFNDARASGWMKPILEAHGDKVRYIRYDTPLVTIHPWALAAAIAGRAVWHQKPDLFWKYKEQVYANQEKLSAFTIDEFARGFASDHELDMKKYDADVQSPDLRVELVNGTGTAFTNDVRATPTYIVNGAFVEAGTDGKGLAEYVNAALKK